MVNPFDRNFFKFLIGFIGILFFSLGVIFLVSHYTTPNVQAGKASVSDR